MLMSQSGYGWLGRWTPPKSGNRFVREASSEAAAIPES